MWPRVSHLQFLIPAFRRSQTSVSLLDLPLSPAPAALPAEVATFLREAELRIEGYGDLVRYPGFVPSDYPQVYHALCRIDSERTAAGNTFCEWGSGFGVAACLAAFTGFKAWGIEIEPALVDAARALAADFSLDVTFLCDSYLPRESCELLEGVEPSLYLVDRPGDVQEHWGLGPEDFDVIFAYPGPDDDRVIADVFGRFGSRGAVLVTFHGRDGIRLRRKVRGRRKDTRLLTKWRP